MRSVLSGRGARGDVRAAIAPRHPLANVARLARRAGRAAVRHAARARPARRGEALPHPRGARRGRRRQLRADRCRSLDASRRHRPRVVRRAARAPAIDAARVRIDVQWLPLLHRSLVVRELAFEGATIDLERIERRRAARRVMGVDPATELPPGWTFALDRIALRDTRLRVRTVAPGARPVARRRRARRAGRDAASGGPARSGGRPNLRVDAIVEGGRIRIDGSTDLRDEGVAVDALVRVKDVPLDRLRPHLPDVGWSALDGRLSGHFHYQRDPGRRDLLDGRRARAATSASIRARASRSPALAIRQRGGRGRRDRPPPSPRRDRLVDAARRAARGARRSVSAPIPLARRRPASRPPAGRRAPHEGRGAPDSCVDMDDPPGRIPRARLHRRRSGPARSCSRPPLRARTSAPVRTGRRCAAGSRARRGGRRVRRHRAHVARGLTDRRPRSRRATSTRPRSLRAFGVPLRGPRADRSRQRGL